MSDTYELKEVNDDGSGYVVFHWADGTSTGQQFHGLPVEDKALFDVALCELMQRTFERVNPTTKRVAADLRATMGRANPMDDLRDAMVAAQSLDVVTLKV